MKNLNFETKFLIAFILIAFVDEVFTFDLGGVFFTPVKMFSVYSFFVFLNNRVFILNKNAYYDKVRKGFTLLYAYILIAIVFALASGGLSLGLIERFFHFLSSLIIIDLLVKYFLSNKINYEKVISAILIVYFIELTVSFVEVIIQRPLINLGVVGLSPLKIRGFHGDRIYLAEYISLGWFLYYVKNGQNLKLFLLGLLSFIVVIVSGSNTATVLFAIVGCYFAYSLRSIFLKVVLIILAILAASTYSFFRAEFLSESDLAQISKRNEMYYEGGADETSNWRLFAIYEIWDDFVENPTLLGHGYEESSRFLEIRSNYLFLMKPHNIVSVLYDYGLIGGVLALILIIGLIKNAIKMTIIKNKTLLTHLSFIFSVLILSRLFLYYHTTIVWVYIVGVAIIAANNRLLLKRNNIS